MPRLVIIVKCLVSYFIFCCVYIYRKFYRSGSKKAVRRTEKKNIKPGIYLQKLIRNRQKKSSVNSHFAVATVDIYTLGATQERVAAGTARDNKAFVHSYIDWFRASPV